LTYVPRFLLAKLYLDSLQGKPSVKAIKTSLGKIRSKSNDSNIYKRAYEGAMERIEHQIVDQATLAKRVLSWLTCARRSLTLTELQHALAVEINETSFDEENLPDIEDMISACAGLVTYNEQSHIITLVHYTTQEYFEQEWTSLFPNAHRDIGQVCLTYVCYDVFASTSYKNDEKRFEHEERLEKYPLYAYAATSWGYHAKQQPLGPPEVVLKLLENGEKSAACGYAQAVGSHESNVLFDESTGSTGLHLAASFGLRAEVEALLEKTRQPDITDSWKETPLFTAVREGHEEVVRILLHHGANPCLQDDVGKTPLSLAAEFGHESLVDRFLELGLDPNVTDKMGWSPLHHAAQEGRLAVVRFLLNKGVQLDPTTPREDLLPWAASHNCTSLIEILLDEGGDINQRDSQNGCTPLAYAVMHGYDLLATLLLKKGANPGSRDKFGRTTLFHALERRYAPFGRKMIPQVILEKYPNLLHYRDDFGRSPILLAAENRQDAILQAIANGREHSVILSMEMETVLCTIRAPGYVLSQDKGEFLTLWAAVHGYLTVINFLLEKGINHLFQDVRGRTPLLLAAKNCHWEVFRAFSNRGLILHVQDKQGYSPLSWAFQARHEVIIQLLFENGADPNEPIKDPDDRYNYRAEAPLFLAVRRESESIVGFLLKIGADPNHFKYETGRCDRIEGESTPSKDIENIVSPLSLAAGKGYHGIVAAFLNNGANLFVCHIALREAMMNGNHSIVSLIMEKGIRDNWIIVEHGESLLYHAKNPVGERSKSKFQEFQFYQEVILFIRSARWHMGKRHSIALRCRTWEYGNCSTSTVQEC
jgi:ankyrin repeat protein